MTDSLTIARKPTLTRSQDYAFLRSEGLRAIERLGHEVWTDFNIHDPGIAMLELFCYAITELGYRTGYDIRDLLTRTVDGMPESVGDFHPSQDILVCNPVTFDDLRKLFIDIPGVRNAWVSINQDLRYFLDRDDGVLGMTAGAGFEERVLNGLYDVAIELEEFVLLKPRVAKVGLSRGPTPLPASEFKIPGGQGMRFNVEHPITIESVAVYGTAAGRVSVRLVDAAGEVLEKVTDAAIGNGRSRIALGFEVPPGEGYRLEATGTDQLLRLKAADLARPYPFSIDHVVHLTSGFRAGAPNGDYLFFFDWRVGYAVAPPAGLRPSRQQVVVGPAKGGGDYESAANRGLDIRSQRDVRLAALQVDAQESGEIVVRLSAAAGAVVAEFAADVQKGANRLEPSGFELKGGAGYRLEVVSADVDLWATAGLGFPVHVDNVVDVETPHPAAAADVALFYDLTFEFPSQPHPLEINEEDVLTAVRERIYTTRNLCEDVVEVCPLKVEEVAVCSDIEVTPEADIDEVLAEMFYRLELHVSPAVKFYSLDEMLARGKHPDEIFEGPLLDHGFIDDDEFDALRRRCEIRTSDVVRIIMDVAGVSAIKSISLLSFFGGNPLRQEDWLLPLEGDGRIHGFTEELSKIVFYRNGLPVFADRTRVAKLLKDKKAADLQTKLKGYDTAVPIPVGQDRDVGRYFPAQNELPMNFMVGQRRVPRSETPLRKSQSLQLKAYLLLFEQIMANHLSQLAHVPSLFSWRDAEEPSYFTQPVFGIAEHEAVYSLDGVIAALADAGEAPPAGERRGRIEAGVPVALEHIVETEEVRVDRRNRFLDHLLARFSEDVTDYVVLMRSMLGDPGLTRTLAHKRTLVQEYPQLSACRGVGRDYRSPLSADSIGGFKRRVYRLLGIETFAALTFADAGIRIEKSASAPDEYRFVMREDPDDVASPSVFESMTCEHRNAIEALLDSVTEHGSEPGNYVGKELRWQCVDDPEPTALGTLTGSGTAEGVAARFAALRVAEGFHLVEHILLRKRTADDDTLAVQLNDPGECECVEVTDPYSFRASVVLPAWPDRFRETRFRRFVEQTLREQAPANVFLKICWIGHEQMRELDACLLDWRLGLAGLTDGLAVCAEEVAPAKPLSGQPLPQPKKPLRAGETPETAPTLPPTAPDAAYSTALGDLIEKLEDMINVYPLATLYDCADDDDKQHDDKPPVTLNNTNLGTF